MDGKTLARIGAIVFVALAITAARDRDDRAKDERAAVALPAPAVARPPPIPLRANSRAAS